MHGCPTGVRGLAPGLVGYVRCLVRLVKGKFVAKVRMGGELGGPGGEAPRFRPQRPRGVGPGGLPPGLGHGIQRGVRGLAPWFRPPRTRGVRGACPPV